MSQVYAAASGTSPVYAAGVSVGAPITASSVAELRAAVLALE